MAKNQVLRSRLETWLGSWSELVALILLFLVLEIAIWSIERAQWITPQPSLTLVLGLAILTGWLLCRSPLSGKTSHLVAVIVGVLITMWQTSNLLPPSETTSWLYQLIMALRSWLESISMAKPSEGTIHFVVFLIFVTWLIGYFSTWFVLRRRSAWMAVSLGATTILVNLNNLPKEYHTLFFFYLLAAILLVGQLNLVRYHYWFKTQGVNYSKRGVMYVMTSLLCIGIVAVYLTSLMPEIRAYRWETLVNAEMRWTKKIEGHLKNTLAAVESKLYALYSSPQTELLFAYFWRDDNIVHFIVTSENPLYLRTQIYDIYTSQGWKNIEADGYIFSQSITSDKTQNYSKRSEISYTVQNELMTNVLLTTGEFISADIPGLIQKQTATGDTISITTPYILKPGQRYTVSASISLATSTDLSKVDEVYPQEIADNYLQLPNTLPERVWHLSQSRTKEAKSPYEKVVAIKRYLAQMYYTREIETPPEGSDGVDYFLFSQKSGNCLYFASAMVVMLRAVGVPSRLCVGYKSGEWDDTTGSNIVRTKHYHAWPEIYFPGYGWIECESVPVIGGESDERAIYEHFYGEYYSDEATADGNSHTSGRAETSHDWTLWLLLAIIAIPSALLTILLLLFALQSIISFWITRFTGSDYVSSIYSRMCFLASLIKLGPKPQQTPLEYCDKLASMFPLQTKPISNIVQAYLKNRFSQRKKLKRVQIDTLQKSWRQLYPTLLKRLFHGVQFVSNSSTTYSDKNWN